MYQNMGEIITDLDKWHKYGVSGCRSVSNFLIFCRKFAQAIESENKREAVKELSHMTHIYRYATDIQYSEEVLLIADMSLEAIKTDFEIAKSNIEEYFCKNFVTGDFEITEGILKKHWDMVDWDAYYNETNRNFIDACKKANKVVGWEKDNEISSIYWEDKQNDDRYQSMQEIFYSTYNGGRVRASFTDEWECLDWSYHKEAQYEDGLYWAEQPAY